MSAVHATCLECEADVALPYPDERLKAIAEAAAARGVLCDRCADAADLAALAEEAEQLSSRVQERWTELLRDSRIDGIVRPDWTIVPGGGEPAARAFGAGEISTLVLTGAVGTGKTTLARWAFAQRLKPTVVQGRVVGRRGAWRRMVAYMAALGSGFGSVQRDDCAELQQGGIVLGLDDLDKTRPSEYAAEQVFGLVDGAIATGSPLVVTTNLPLGQLAGKWPAPFGEAIASRLDEGTVVHLDGPDLRDRRNR